MRHPMHVVKGFFKVLRDGLERPQNSDWNHRLDLTDGFPNWRLFLTAIFKLSNRFIRQSHPPGKVLTVSLGLFLNASHVSHFPNLLINPSVSFIPPA